MKNLRIIEDASPFYIRFTFDGIEEIIDTCNKVVDTYDNLDHMYGCHMDERFETITKKRLDHPDEYKDHLTVYRVQPDDTKKIVDALPWENELMTFDKWQQLIMYSGPGYWHVIHKDRTNVGINFYFRVQDDKCISTFYTEEELDKFNDKERQHEFYESIGNYGNVTYGGGPLRRVFNVDFHQPIPNKTFVGQQGEGMLFNSDIWHTWANFSDKARGVLLMRYEVDGKFSFDEAKKKLFNL